MIDSGYFAGGAVTERFGQEFASFVGVEHCVGTANGLDSIRLILEAYGIGPGDEVIVPAFTYYATWLGVMQTGATPVPVDVIATTANIDPTTVEAAITQRTRAIIPVHLYGQGADVASLRTTAAAHGLIIVEDAAQSHGAMSTAGMTGQSAMPQRSPSTRPRISGRSGTQAGSPRTTRPSPTGFAAGDHMGRGRRSMITSTPAGTPASTRFRPRSCRSTSPGSRSGRLAAARSLSATSARSATGRRLSWAPATRAGACGITSC